MQVVVSFSLLWAATRLPSINGCSGSAHSDSTKMDPKNLEGDGPPAREQEMAPKGADVNSDLLIECKKSASACTSACKKAPATFWPSACYCTQDSTWKKCKDFCKANAKDFGDVCNKKANSPDKKSRSACKRDPKKYADVCKDESKAIDAACKGTSATPSKCNAACEAADRNNGVCACTMDPGADECKAFCEYNKIDHPKLCSEGEGSEEGSDGTVGTTDGNLTTTATAETAITIDPDIVAKCQGEGKDILECKKACSENTLPPCVCFATSTMDECEAFCKESDTDYPVPCDVLEIDAACHGNDSTILTCYDACEKENTTAQVVEVCNCYSPDKNESDACDTSFCESFKDYAPCQLRGCSKPKALLKECDASCKALGEQSIKEEVCQCTPKGRKEACMNKESGPCDGTKADNTTKEMFNDYCETIGDVHDVIDKCIDLEGDKIEKRAFKPKNNTEEDKFDFHFCRRTCTNFSTNHPQDVDDVMECKCILFEDCAELCQKPNKETHLKLCEAEGKINRTFKDCIGPNAKYTDCAEKCETVFPTDEPTALICKCVPNFDDRHDPMCLDIACNLTRNKYEQICQKIENFTDVDKYCRGDKDSEADSKKCQVACKSLDNGKPQICVNCMDFSANEDCSTFCAEHFEEYSLICNEIFKDNTTNFKWTVKDMSTNDPMVKVRIAVKGPGGKDYGFNFTNKTGILITPNLPWLISIKAEFLLVGYEQFTIDVMVMERMRTVYMTKNLKDEKVFRTALFWPEGPTDLDFHILAYDKNTGKAKCHGFYSQGKKTKSRKDHIPGCYNDTIILELDNYDNIDLFRDRPETLHVNHMDNGTAYLLYVTHFTYDEPKSYTSLADSKAKVMIVGKNTPYYIEIPTKDPYEAEKYKEKSRFWYIGCVDGKFGIRNFTIISKLSRFDPVIGLEWLYLKDHYRQYFEDPAGICENLDKQKYPACGDKGKDKTKNYTHDKYRIEQDFYLEKATLYQDICGENKLS